MPFSLKETLERWPQPLVVAHRGLWEQSPENSLGAFQAAVSAGIGAIELDIQICGSGEMVVFHDWDTQRLSGIARSIRRTPWKELQAIPLSNGEHIPSLNAILEALPEKIFLDVEIKWGWPRRFPLEKELLGQLGKRILAGKILISSFNPMVIRSLSRYHARPPLALIFSKHRDVPFFLRKGQARKYSQCDLLKPHKDLLSPDSRLWQENRPILPWGIENASQARELLDRGALGVITDWPKNILADLSEAQVESHSPDPPPEP